MVTELATTGATLTLRSNKEGWCMIDLMLPNKTFRLGAEARYRVFSRLEAAMEERLTGEVCGVLEGLSLFWVLSLSEKHGAIYVANREGERVLFFQDASASWLGSIALTNEERERWRIQLRAERDAAAFHNT